MKRFLCLSLLFICALPVLTGCGAVNGAADMVESGMDMVGDAAHNMIDPQNDTNDNRASMLTKKEAEDIAFGKAGVSRDEAENIRCEYEHDNGRGYYEIEFYANGVEYDIKVDSDDGNIMSFDKG